MGDMTEAEREGFEARKRREMRDTILGSVLIVGGVAVLLVSKWTASLDLLTAGVSLALTIGGGLMTKPEVFGDVARNAIAALPGGKE